MESQVDQFVKRHELIPHGSTIVIGVSGGPDSMALLHYLLKRKESWDLRLVVCSVDHRLRDDESRKDLEHVAAYCRENGVRFESGSVDVPGFMVKHKLGTEEAARICRYQVFEEVMNNHHADLLALAHHGDDQVETMLMRQVRGSFGISKAGIPVTRPIACGMVVRPFLSITKDDIELYCKKNDIPSRYDPTNHSDKYTRNRFRKVVLPFLKKEDPEVHLRFQQDSERMTDDYQYLETLAIESLPEIIEEKATTFVMLSISRLLKSPVPLQRRMIHLILNYLYKKAQIHSEIQFLHIELVLQWLKEKSASGMLNLPKGIEVERSYNHCILRFGHAQTKGIIERRLEIPGQTVEPFGTIQAEVTHTYFNEYKGPERLICDYNHVSFPLTIRNRKDGDRLRPAGFKGTKKLKDLFIDHKIPRSLRDEWPIIVDGKGEVIWVPLLRHGDYARLAPSTTQFLVLTFEPTDNFRRICNEG